MLLANRTSALLFLCGLWFSGLSPRARVRVLRFGSVVWSGFERFIWSEKLWKSRHCWMGFLKQLQADIPWLMVRADGDLYRLSVGSQPSFAVLSASEHDSLEKALFAASQLVEDSPGTLPPDF